MKQELLPIYEDKNIIEFADTQLSVFWTADEIKVDKDIQDVLTNFSEAEKHAVLTTLKLFSIYETHIGDEWWSGRFKEMFPRADYHRMGSVFSMFELAVHAPFYNKINELLYINTPEFYMSYQHDPVLAARVEHIGEMLNDPDDCVALGSFCMTEGVILYGNFGFLKHYQSQGKNKLSTVVRGINFSVRDEALHAKATAYAFKEKFGKLNKVEQEVVIEKLKVVAQKIYDHECLIIAKLFEKGKIPGITPHQLENFIQSRINVCFSDMGLKSIYHVTYDPISEWFYKGINDYQFNDFFQGTGREYNRMWDEEGFTWKS